MIKVHTVADLQAAICRSHFHQLFQPKVLVVDHERLCLCIKMAMSETLERQPGTGQWHGGSISAIIDITGCYALALLTGEPPPTINFRTDYLRPALDTDLTATARVRQAGRTIGVVDVDVDDAHGRLIAVGRASYSTRSLQTMSSDQRG